MRVELSLRMRGRLASRDPSAEPVLCDYAPPCARIANIWPELTLVAEQCFSV